MFVQFAVEARIIVVARARVWVRVGVDARISFSVCLGLGFW